MFQTLLQLPFYFILFLFICSFTHLHIMTTAEVQVEFINLSCRDCFAEMTRFIYLFVIQEIL